MISMSRSRASTLDNLDTEATELQTRLNVLARGASSLDSADQEILYTRLESAHLLRQTLVDNTGSSHTRDTFRRLNGFETLISAAKDVSQSFALQGNSREKNKTILINLLQAILGVLGAALEEHKGNQKYFRQRVQGGGWLSIRDLLQPMLHQERNPPISGLEVSIEQLFGCLLACALNDDSMAGFFKSLRRELDGCRKKPSQPEQNSMTSGDAGSHDIPEYPVEDWPSFIHTHLRKGIPSQAQVHNPDAILIMFDLWKDLNAQAVVSSRPSLFETASVTLGLPSIINHIVTQSISSFVVVHGSGLLNLLLIVLLDSSSMEQPLLHEVRNLAMTLLTIGVANLEDAHLLFRHACSSPLIADLLLMSLQSSRSPSFVHFDLSLHGFASIEIPGIGGSFPPGSSSAGYTLSLWFQIIEFDPDAHTTIFGAFDSSQSCFVLVYLEKDTRSLILQTSVSSSRPSVRFKSVSFKERRWYHAVITHRRPKTTSSARASLFIDGEFVEQVRSQYPAAPPATNGNDVGASSPSSNRRAGAIQAFLGTPQDLASKLGKGLVSTQWRLASANLLADVLSDDLIAVYYELGPRYSGNYQDCLGSFQTYQASAALNLRNESLHPGKEEKSDIVSAIRSKAGALLPESNILLNISANVVLDDEDQNNIDETHLLKLISKTAGKNLRNVTRGGRNALAINGAIPSINKALLHSFGFAVLTGDPIVVVPQSLDDAAWRVGGCAAVGLAVLEASKSPDDIFKALNILFESVQENWRNSEAMERENGFGVLSTLLSAKMVQQAQLHNDSPRSSSSFSNSKQTAEPLSMRVLTAILKFLGYRADKPEDSVINNPLAYRILLVDMDLWRTSDPSTQKLYYKQFIVFGLDSKFHTFNSKRLSRMREHTRQNNLLISANV